MRPFHEMTIQKQPSIVKSSRFSKALLISALLALLSNASFAVQIKTLPNFKAEYEVQFMGFNLGLAHHQFFCQADQCTLTSNAKPEGWVARFVNESTKERIQIRQTETDQGHPAEFLWQSYHKTLYRKKSDKLIVKNYDLVRRDGKILYLQSEPPLSWPARPGVYDAVSMAYAIQFRQLNQQAFSGLFLQDEKGQYPLTLTQSESDSVEVDWEENELPTQQLRFKSSQANITVWLAPSLNFFPVQVEVYNKETRKTVTLTLHRAPKISS